MLIAIRCFFIGTMLGDVDVRISLMLVLLIKSNKHTTDDHCEQNEVTEILYSEFTASQSGGFCILSAVSHVHLAKGS